MIYFVNHTDFIKIGYTVDIRKRISDLQLSCPIPISVVGLIDGTIREEKVLHEKFKDIWSHGEWFRYTKELSDFIESLDKSMIWKYGFDNFREKLEENIIRKCRIESNTTIRDLAKMVGISEKGINAMEIRCAKGEMSVKNIKKVIGVMGYEYQGRAIKKKS